MTARPNVLSMCLFGHPSAKAVDRKLLARFAEMSKLRTRDENERSVVVKDSVVDDLRQQRHSRYFFCSIRSMLNSLHRPEEDGLAIHTSNSPISGLKALTRRFRDRILTALVDARVAIARLTKLGSRSENEFDGWPPPSGASARPLASTRIAMAIAAAAADGIIALEACRTVRVRRPAVATYGVDDRYHPGFAVTLSGGFLRLRVLASILLGTFTGDSAALRIDIKDGGTGTLNWQGVFLATRDVLRRRMFAIAGTAYVYVVNMVAFDDSLYSGVVTA